MIHRTQSALEAGLQDIQKSPLDKGRLELIVVRPANNQRNSPTQGRLDPVIGLDGDNWQVRGSKTTPDGSADPERQLTLMNSRAANLIAGDRTRWPLAGDQLFIDLSLDEENLPAGTLLEIGTAVIEITSPPHTGCKKFVDRFGVAAMKFVNSPTGRKWNLRGVNARVVTGGDIHIGDIVKKRQS